MSAVSAVTTILPVFVAPPATFGINCPNTFPDFPTLSCVQNAATPTLTLGNFMLGDVNEATAASTLAKVKHKYLKSSIFVA